MGTSGKAQTKAISQPRNVSDAEGRETELTFPDGQRFWTARDGLGRATDIYQGPLGSTSNIMAAFSYRPGGQLYYFARKYGDNGAFYYDGARRLATAPTGSPAASATPGPIMPVTPPAS